VSVSVALSFAETGSVQPDGTDALAVFDREPDAAGDTVPLTTSVATAPDARSSVVATAFPDPDTAPHAPVPDVTEHVHDTPVTAAGTTSLTVAPVTAEGPSFVTVTV
jgi:hypothetical protein